MSERHYDKDEFPKRCDHCPAPLLAGTRYRKVLAVLDADDSFVGGQPAAIENSFELVFCHRCYGRLSDWILNPLSEIPPEGEPPAELDEAELEEELERELFILGDGEEGLRSQASGFSPEAEAEAEGGCVLHPKGFDSICYQCHLAREARQQPRKGRGDCLACGGCYGAHTPDCPSYLAPERAPCKHHPGADCGCLCRFGTCGMGTCPLLEAPELLAVRIALDPELFRSTSDSFHAEEGECTDPECPVHSRDAGGGPKLCTGSDSQVDPDRMPKPCLDPDQMLGAGDQFPGCDYDVEKLL